MRSFWARCTRTSPLSSITFSAFRQIFAHHFTSEGHQIVPLYPTQNQDDAEGDDGEGKEYVVRFVDIQGHLSPAEQKYVSSKISSRLSSSCFFDSDLGPSLTRSHSSAPDRSVTWQGSNPPPLKESSRIPLAAPTIPPLHLLLTKYDGQMTRGWSLLASCQCLSRHAKSSSPPPSVGRRHFARAE